MINTSKHRDVTPSRYQFKKSLLVSSFVLMALSGCKEIEPLVSQPATAKETGVPEFIGEPISASSLPKHQLPVDNPYLSSLGKNGLHFDSYNSDVTNFSGPLGNPFVLTSHRLNPQAIACPTILFNRQGMLITVCLEYGVTRLLLIEPRTLSILAEHTLPPKQNKGDASGGGYAHLDNDDHVILNNTDGTITKMGVKINSSLKPEWYLVEKLDLSTHLPEGAYLNDGVPDYKGRMWFTSGKGLVGYIDNNTLTVELYDFGIGLQNQIAIDPSGVYVAVQGSMNKLTVDNNGQIQLAWSTPYQNNGSGVLAPGTGTTPTLFGKNDNYVAIADNGYPQLNLNIYHRTTGKEVCSHPVFEPEKGGAENSVIGYQNSVVLENNGAYDGLFGNPLKTENGLVRIDVDDDSAGCTKVWENRELKHMTTPVLSTDTGLIYTYNVMEGSIQGIGYYMSAVDWFTGKTAYQAYLGSGSEFSELLQPVTLGPDGTYYMATRNGLLSVREIDD